MVSETPVFTCLLAGYGHIGRRHRMVIDALPGFKLVGIADPNLPNTDEAVHVFSRAEALPAGLADVISICTPNGMHAEQGIQAVEKGYHVILEKPMALGSGESNRLLEKANDLGKQVFVVKQNRFSPIIQWLNQLLRSDHLGRVYQVSVQCYWNRGAEYFDPSGWHGSQALDGGPLYTQFSHFIDILWHLFGPLQSGKPEFFNYNHPYLPFEDSGWFGFYGQSGVEGVFQYSLSAFGKNMESSMTILAENGTLKIGGAYMDTLEYVEFATEAPALQVQDALPGLPQVAQLHARFYQHVYAVLTGVTQPAGETEEASSVVAFIENIYRHR